MEHGDEGADRGYRQIVESVREGIWRIDAAASTTFVNRVLEEMLGYAPGEMLGRSAFEFMDEEGRDIAAQAIQRRRQGISEVQETKYIRKDGSALWAIVHHSPLVDPSGEYVGALAMLTDNTERRKTEAALRATEERYRLLFEGSPLPKWLTESDTLRFIDVNEAACRLWGYSKQELLGMSVADILPARNLAPLQQAAAAAAPGHVNYGVWKHQRKDGTLVDVDIHVHRILFEGRPARLVVGQDVTGRRRIEAQLTHAQKMEAIGLLAGGIGHDFNNIVSVIATYTGFVLDALGPNDPRRDDLAEVVKASERARSLTRQLLTFSQQQILQPTLMDLGEAIGGVLGMLARIVGEGIELSYVAGRALWRINADPGQLDQLVMNLVVNARDAMPDGGNLTIETANVELDAEAAARTPGVLPGRYVMLAITDTGVGMSPATRERIFEPFFTTKELGKGTGLGLSSVLGITQQSGGHLSVESELGLGTAFRIFLPWAAEALEQDESHPPDGAFSGTETILVVEDDDQVRQLVRTILRRNGYRVLEARNAGEALLVCEQHRGDIHLLLTDVIMPKMNGWQLAERLGPTRPNMKVLFMSGYINDAAVYRRMADADVALLQKPLTPDSVSRKVREVLGAPA